MFNFVIYEWIHHFRATVSEMSDFEHFHINCWTWLLVIFMNNCDFVNLLINLRIATNCFEFRLFLHLHCNSLCFSTQVTINHERCVMQSLQESEYANLHKKLCFLATAWRWWPWWSELVWKWWYQWGNRLETKEEWHWS